MAQPILPGFALGILAFVCLPAAAQPSCDLAAWQACPDAMLVAPIEPGESEVGALRFFSDMIVDLSDYRTAQYLQTRVPAGTSTKEWHAHQFDAIITPVEGKSRFWWLNRDTGERKNVVFDADRRAYLLIPEGVPHFVDQRAADVDALVVEFLLAKDVWTAEDFVAHREHVDEPFPPVMPLE
jgi:uncharacterized RmlC-like cupin family protein